MCYIKRYYLLDVDGGFIIRVVNLWKFCQELKVFFREDNDGNKIDIVGLRFVLMFILELNAKKVQVVQRNHPTAIFTTVLVKRLHPVALSNEPKFL